MNRNIDTRKATFSVAAGAHAALKLSQQTWFGYPGRQVEVF
jgi:hypothetical protein